jgi:hypothetical protein
MTSQIIRIRNRISELYNEDENININIEKFFVPNVYFIQIIIKQ